MLCFDCRDCQCCQTPPVSVQRAVGRDVQPRDADRGLGPRLLVLRVVLRDPQGAARSVEQAPQHLQVTAFTWD